MAGEPAPTRAGRGDDELVGQIDVVRDRLRDQARARLGVTGTSEAPAPLRAALREHRLSLYPLVALSGLAVVDSFFVYGFSVLTPDISHALGLSIGLIAGLLALDTLFIAVSPLPIAALTQHKPRRALLCLATATVWTVVTLYAGLVTGALTLVVVLLIDGLSTGSVTGLHVPMLMDSYPPKARVRAVSAYTGLGTNGLARVLAPLLVAALTGPLSLTWRGVFVAFGGLSMAATLFATGLRDPGFGRFDTDELRATVRQAQDTGQAASGLDAEDTALGFFEIMHRLMLVPTIRRLFWGFLVAGVFQVPYATFLSFFLEQRWGLGPTARGLVFGLTAAVSMLAVAAFARWGEAAFGADPGRLVSFAGLTLLISLVLICAAALVPVFALMVALFAIIQGLITLPTPALNIALLSVIQARWRPHAAALVGIALAFGGFAGAFFLSGVQGQYGTTGAVIATSIPGLFGALIIRSARRLVAPDIDRVIDEVLEDEEIRQISASGERLPMLACRGVDFAYGQVQVLFDVGFTVDEGEMVALLGTNGAGKSTLLKVISGIGLPSRGQVRFRGEDVTYLDAERRLRLGITQVPGGRAVFGPLSVVDNLRVFGYTLGRDRRAVADAIDRSLAAFPRLADLRTAKARTLSGGEQQMLGLAKALMLQPRLLLIDELSLGLAPVVVGHLLDMVREINRAGTAVVLVEQSVNIALTLVEHAYFMEKGQIRFDGRAGDLLARGDLLRSVFFEGAGAAS